VNSKNDKEVFVDYRHDYRYGLRELQAEYLPELTLARQNTSKTPGRKSKVVHLHNVRSLHYARLLDLVKIAELRDYDLRGHREQICFLYRYWSCCLTDDLKESLNQMLEFNSEFKEPLPKREVERATRSAEKAWKAKSDVKANEEAIAKGYPGAGYNLKNATIIRWLDITPEEQQHLKTIIDGNEKCRRKRERDKLAYREKHNAVTREAYLDQQKENTEDKLWQLKQAIKRHPNATRKELADLLGMHRSYLYRLLRQL